MIITGISNTNPFPLLNNVYIDAANPLADASNIPADNASLSNIVDLIKTPTKDRNVFTQSNIALQPLYIHNAINGNNIIRWNGFNSCMTCPYNAVSNGYNGPMTITFAWMSNVIGTGTNNRMFGRENDGNDGFSTGIIENTYVFTSTGFGDGQSTPQVIANVFEVVSIRLGPITNGLCDLDFFKNGSFVYNVADFPAPADNTSDLILGGFRNNLTGLNWDGDLLLMGWAWQTLTPEQIALLHNYAMTRMGI